MTEDAYAGQYLYQVWGNGQVLEQLSLQPGHAPLTFRDQIDMGRLFDAAWNQPV